MKKIKGVFFDLGGTLRIAENVPEHQEKAKRHMAELAGYEDADAFIDMVEQRYLPYRDWALGEMSSRPSTPGATSLASSPTSSASTRFLSG